MEKMIAVCFALALNVSAQDILTGAASVQNTNNSTRELPAWRYTTLAYEKEAAKLLLQEASRIADQLQLKERTPLTTNDIFAIHIPPPAMQMLGTLSTSNYTYYFSAYRKFSGVDVRRNNQSWNAMIKEFTWPASRLDISNSFKEGVEILRKASVDVDNLEKDCNRSVEAVWPDGTNAGSFVPDYWIRWKQRGKTIVALEFIEPTRAIQGLHIDDPKYMLEKPVKFENLKSLLMEGGTPPPRLLEKMHLNDTNIIINSVHQ